MNYAIILSGGIGARMNTNGFPKQYISVNNKPIIVYTLEKFEINNHIDSIIIVAAKEWQGEIKKWCEQYKILKFVRFALPGETRQESVLHGLEACGDCSEDDNVIIHDSVRPLVNDSIITNCINALNTYDGSMPAVPVNDTVYLSDNGTDISSLIDRSKLFAGQSPEAYKLKKYYEINKIASKEELNKTRGSSELAFNHGLKVKIIQGDYGNFKITTPTDLQRFKSIIGE